MGALGDLGLRAAGRLAHIPPVERVPAGRVLRMPGRGSTYLVDTGPPPLEAGRPTLVLLHALACTGLLTWYPSLDALSERYRVIVFDQRWHGAGIRSRRFRLSDCADDVAAVADAVGLDTFVPVGYSMGSLVAQLVWQRHPDRVEGAVFAASTTNFARPGGQARALQRVSTVVGQAAEWRSRALGLRDRHDSGLLHRWAFDQFRATSGPAITAATAEITRFDSSAWIDRMNVPTSVVLTARDKAIRPAQQRRLARLLPDCTTYEVDAGHASCVLEAERFRPALLAACASVASRTAARVPR